MPIEWTVELMERICAEVSSGRSIRDIVTDDWCPSQPSVYRRMASDPDFAAMMAQAREAQQHHEADHCVELADTATAENWQVVKLQIWARQWRAAKLAPHVYGDRVATQQLGKDGQPSDPVAPILSITVVDSSGGEG